MSPTPEMCLYWDRWASGACGSDIQAFAPLVGFILFLGVYVKFRDYVPTRREMWAGGLIGLLGLSLILVGFFPTVEYTGGRSLPDVDIESGELSESGEIVLNVRNTGGKPLSSSFFRLGAAYGSESPKAYVNISESYRAGEGLNCSAVVGKSVGVFPGDRMRCSTGLVLDDAQNVTMYLEGVEGNVGVAESVVCSMSDGNLECR